MIQEPSADEVFARLDKYLELLAAPREQQEAWAAETNSSIEEMRLQLLDVVPDLFPMMEAQLLIDAVDEENISRLIELMDGMPGVDKLYLWTDWDAVESQPEWMRVRQQASIALEMLRRPLNQKVRNT